LKEVCVCGRGERDKERGEQREFEKSMWAGQRGTKESGKQENGRSEGDSYPRGMHMYVNRKDKNKMT
jgi:hypothetical protein